jgi:hypothetical protein
VHRFLAAGGQKAVLSEVRSDFWRIRIDDPVMVLRRADERGELHPRPERQPATISPPFTVTLTPTSGSIAGPRTTVPLRANRLP